MKSRTLLKLLRSGQLPVLIGLTSLLKPVYRTYFLAAAASHGILGLLAGGPMPLDRLTEALAIGPEDAETFRAWLDIGVRLGELASNADGYRLRSWWARKLADGRNDVAAAALEEVVRFHHDALYGAPGLIKQRRRLSLADQDGELVARATRVLGHFVEEAIDATLPERGGLRLLEVGCGEGAYIRYACRRNPELSGLGLDLQPDVADVAARNIAAWGLADRFRVQCGDVRSATLGAEFDVVTLFNLIYYFPFAERVAVLERLASLLRPGGKLVLTTGTKGGNLGLDVISLWFAASDAGGRVPAPSEMVAQMRAAGFRDVSARNLLPGDGYYAFTGTR